MTSWDIMELDMTQLKTLSNESCKRLKSLLISMTETKITGKRISYKQAITHFVTQT